jgi:thiamine monophosphate synthase
MDILQQSGFDGAAVLGAIWEAEDPIASYIKIKETIKGFEDA